MQFPQTVTTQWSSLANSVNAKQILVGDGSAAVALIFDDMATYEFRDDITTTHMVCSNGDGYVCLGGQEIKLQKGASTVIPKGVDCQIKSHSQMTLIVFV